MRGRKHRKVWWVFFGSERLTNKDERRHVKEDLKRGREPQPKYTTGKFWTD